jgi:hypothetical protein
LLSLLLIWSSVSSYITQFSLLCSNFLIFMFFKSAMLVSSLLFLWFPS